MDPSKQLAELQRRLAELKNSFDQLGRKLATVEARLRNPGCPPDPTLIEELSEAVRSFDFLEQELEQAPDGIEAQAARVRLSGLICALLRERRLEPAYWLACYHKQKFGAPPAPPVLIKAVELADIIEGDGGPAARWLAHAYRHPDFREVRAGQPGEAGRLALNLLMVAALLRPALAAPGSGAPEALAGLDDLPPGIAAVGDLLAGRGQADPGWEKELEALSAEARSWQRHNRKLYMVAPLAAKLWKTMQKEGELLQRLLRPVIEKDTAAADEIRSLVNRLRDEDELKSEIARLYRRMQEMDAQLDIFHILGSWQVLARLREVLDLVERWLGLQARLTEARKQAAAPGHDELRKFLQAARDDLDGVLRQYPDHPLVAAGVSLCGHALALLEEFLRRDRKTAPGAEELAARECGKHPQLKLEPFWMPPAEAIERLGKALVELLDDLPAEQREGAVEKGRFAEMLAAESAELDRLWGDDGILTPQEKKFIRDTFFDRLEKKDPEAG
jgi:hypothetical protein